MPTEIYGLVQDNKMLRAALDNRDRAIQDLSGLLQRYMQHVIDTKGTSYLDRHGLLPTDSKALSLFDLSILKGIEAKCDMQSRAVGRSTESTGENLKPSLPQSLPGTGFLQL